MRRSRTFQRQPVAFGANCGVGPAQLMDSVIGLVRGADQQAIVVAKSNCGIPVLDDDMRVGYNGTPEVLATYALHGARRRRAHHRRMLRHHAGAHPEHRRRAREPARRVRRHRTMKSSAGWGRSR